MSWFFTLGGQSIGASASVLPMYIDLSFIFSFLSKNLGHKQYLSHMVLGTITCVDTHKGLQIAHRTLSYCHNDHLYTEGQHCLIGVGNRLYLFLKKEEQCSGLPQGARKPSQFSELRILALNKSREGTCQKNQIQNLKPSFNFPEATLYKSAPFVKQS